MFGHQDENTPTDNNAPIPDDSIQGALQDQPAQDTTPPGIDPLPPADPAAAAPADPAPAVDHYDAHPEDNWQHPGAPVDSLDNAQPQPISDVISPAGGFPKTPTFPNIPTASAPAPMPPMPTPTPTPSPVVNDSTRELIDIKQQALSELSPLIDELDQAPEEKFRTVMMMIQASDDQQLVKKAFQVAHSIEDERDRAQALLDIVNEINYFTQQPTAEN